MSEEEKKAYEELKSLLYTGTISQYGKRKLIYIIEEQQNKIASLKKQIKLMQSCDLAKVIKKQQKEIEELKEKNASLQKEIKLMKSININDNYISKDKIREKINKLKEEQKEYKGSQEWEIQDDILAQIMILEELLKEEYGQF